MRKMSNRMTAGQRGLFLSIVETSQWTKPPRVSVALIVSLAVAAAIAVALLARSL